VAAAVSGGQPPPQSNIENLLDIDFDGTVPASAQKSPGLGMSGLEGLAGTPQRVASPAVHNGAPPPPMSGMEDLMGLSDLGGMSGGFGDSNQDILQGFASLDMSGSNQPPPAHEQLSMGGNSGKQTNEDLLGLF
jgi:AP-1 complex subunit beta-1